MARIAISLPDALLEVIEEQCAARKLSRSEFLRNAVEQLLQADGEVERRER